MTITFKCKCGNIFEKDFENNPPLSSECPKCGKKALKSFQHISFDKEDENITSAMQTMLYSSNPSGSNNSVI